MLNTFPENPAVYEIISQIYINLVSVTSQYEPWGHQSHSWGCDVGPLQLHQCPAFC